MSLTLLLAANLRTSGGKIVEPFLRRLGNRCGIPYRRVAPVVDVVQHDPHTLLERHTRSPAEHPLNLRGVGKGTVRLAGPLRNVHDGTANQRRQLIDAVGVRAADIEDLAGDAAAG